MMRVCGVAMVLLGLGVMSLAAQGSCLDPGALVQLDGEWERALLESDAERLAAMLADDFIWVHDHASLTDTKSSLLERASDPAVGATGATRSRVSSDVVARVLGSTGVVTGFTEVDRGPGPTTYNFMRTYVEISGTCLLLANHTMQVPKDGG